MRLHIPAFASFGLALVIGAAWALTPVEPPHREAIEWCDIWHSHANEDALPRVLLVGDSIARGYYDGVEKALEGRAYVSRLTTSRSVCDAVFFNELGLVLGQYPFAVVHFNNGLHGWDYTEQQYRLGFKELAETLQLPTPHAPRLVCATNTPVLENGGMADSESRVVARNDIVRELCNAAGIPVNDLYAVAAGKPGLYAKDGVHFGDEGRAALARAVSGAISPLLDRVAR